MWCQQLSEPAKLELHLNSPCSSSKSVILCHKLEDNFFFFSLKKRLACCECTAVVHHCELTNSSCLHLPLLWFKAVLAHPSLSAKVPRVAMLDTPSCYPSDHDREALSEKQMLARQEPKEGKTLLLFLLYRITCRHSEITHSCYMAQEKGTMNIFRFLLIAMKRVIILWKIQYLGSKWWCFWGMNIMLFYFRLIRN